MADHPKAAAPEQSQPKRGFTGQGYNAHRDVQQVPTDVGAHDNQHQAVPEPQFTQQSEAGAQAEYFQRVQAPAASVAGTQRDPRPTARTQESAPRAARTGFGVEPQFSPQVAAGLGSLAIFAWPMIQYIVSKGRPYVMAFIRDLLDEAEKADVPES